MRPAKCLMHPLAKKRKSSRKEPFMFNQVRRDKISISIVEQIRRAIVEGRFKPGDQLPSEKEMTVQFGVSKHTLREALRALEAMGLLQIRKGAGGGPVVVEIDQGSLNSQLVSFFSFKDISIADLSQVRRLLEPFLAKEAARKMQSAQIRQLHELNRKCASILARGRSIVGGREEIDFHVCLARAAGNPVLETFLDFVNSYLAQLKLEHKPGKEFSQKVLESHQAIARAIEQRDGDLAAELMLRHVIEVEQDLPLDASAAATGAA